MRVAITRVSTCSDDSATCPYPGAVWNQKDYEWQVEVSSFDEIMDRFGEIIINKSQLTKTVQYNVMIYDERMS